MSWEDDSAGFINVILSASFDGGFTWSAPIQVNDNWASTKAGTNPAKTDEFQPNLTWASDGTVSVAFYDRRLDCPASGTDDATNAGLASIQFYKPDLTPKGNNIRISANTWDPQLNAAHYASANVDKTFIGDYFGNTTAGSIDYTTSVSTFNDGTNPDFRQQQIVATIPVP